MISAKRLSLSSSSWCTSSASRSATLLSHFVANAAGETTSSASAPAMMIRRIAAAAHPPEGTPAARFSCSGGVGVGGGPFRTAAVGGKDDDDVRRMRPMLGGIRTSSSRALLSGADSAATLFGRSSNHPRPLFQQRRRYRSTAASAVGGSSSAITLRKLTSPFLLLCHPDRTPLVGSALDPSATSAREINLRAVQTLNGLIDAVESIYDRAANPAGRRAAASARGRVDLPPSAVEIEFLVPSDASVTARGIRGIMKPKARDRDRTLTRRSVVLRFPRGLVERTKSVDAATGRYDLAAAREVRLRMGSELARLCRAAGCGVPDGYREWLAQNGAGPQQAAARRRIFEAEEEEEEAHRYDVGDYLAEELDLDGSRRSRFDSSSASPRFSSGERGAARRRRRRPPMTPYEKSRERFVNSVDWKEQRRRYERAYDDAIADMATYGTVSGSDELKGALISTVLGKVRVDATMPGEERKEGAAAASTTASSKAAEMASVEKKDDAGNRDATSEAGGAAIEDSETPSSTDAGNDTSDNDSSKAHAAPPAPPTPAELESLGLGPVGQLIALRRLSLLLEDHFDELEMEQQGRMWENLTVVLTPQRSVPDVAAADGTAQRTAAPPRPSSSRRRKKGTVRESGFKFTYGGDSSGDDDDSDETAEAVTARIPVDFTDAELIREFKHHLGEYYMMFGPNGRGADGNLLDEFLPSYMRPQNVARQYNK